MLIVNNELKFDKKTIERHKRFIKDYILGLFEVDLTRNITLVQNDMIEKDLISCDDKVDYIWLDSDFERICIDISCDDKHKLYEVEINVKEI